MQTKDAPEEMRIANRPDSRADSPPRINTTRLLVLSLVVLLAVSVYLIFSSRVYSVGFPLDDAWIHQTYARNLALRGEWAFIPGQPSAGSTAPLWSLLLAVGYLLGLSPYIWTFLLGAISLFCLAWVGEAWFRTSIPGLRSPIPWAGLFLAGEWHLAWASVSGMETVLAGLLILVVLWRLNAANVQRSEGRAWGVIGLLIGLSIWVRPDGITLLGPAVLVLFFMEFGWGKRLRGFAWLVLGVLLLFIPYLSFNLAVSGSIWPNTFYAKQAEYALQRELPIWLRFFNEVTLPLIGSGLFLLPGFIAFAVYSWREKNWAALGALAWFLGYALLYALRLPVTYQYGRYFMPAMPVYFITGLIGSWRLVVQMRGRRTAWLLARVAILSTALLWLAFYILGAARYAQNVAFIETEMVSAAKWTAANTDPNALIAAHDIGAMGYFGQRRILDLAGLVSPEVIPFIRDEGRLAGWLDENHADYLVVLSGWYTHLPNEKTPVYQSNGSFAAQAGGGSMMIYRWSP